MELLAEFVVMIVLRLLDGLLRGCALVIGWVVARLPLRRIRRRVLRERAFTDRQGVCRVVAAGALLLVAGSAPVIGAEPGSPQPPNRSESPDRPGLPQGQIPDLGRPTEAGDEVPTFDYDAYFPGVWAFEWRVPDSPLGPGGLITGTETFDPGGDGRNYRATVEAEGPDGPFTTASTIIYLAGQRAFVRHDTDSRGFAMLRAGRIGGDLGGFYTIHYETAPFEANGQQVRLRMTTRLVSPVNYRVESRISVDGGPFINFGNAWWRKSLPGVTAPE